MKFASSRRPKLCFSVDCLEGRLLPASLVALNAASLQIQQNQTAVQLDLGSKLQSFTAMVSTAEQAAVSTAVPLIQDELTAKQLAVTDAKNGNAAAARLDLARAARDLQESNTDKNDLNQEIALGRQVVASLNAQATSDTLTTTRDEKALTAGRNPAVIVAQNAAQTQLVEQNAARIVSQGSARLAVIEANVRKLLPGGVQTGLLPGTLLGYATSVPIDVAGGINIVGVTATNVKTTGGLVSGTLTFDGLPNSPATFSGSFNAQGVASGTVVFDDPGGEEIEPWTGDVRSSGIVMSLTVSDGSSERINLNP